MARREGAPSPGGALERDDAGSAGAAEGSVTDAADSGGGTTDERPRWVGGARLVGAQPREPSGRLPATRSASTRRAMRFAAALRAGKLVLGATSTPRKAPAIVRT